MHVSIFSHIISLRSSRQKNRSPATRWPPRSCQHCCFINKAFLTVITDQHGHSFPRLLLINHVATAHYVARNEKQSHSLSAGINCQERMVFQKEGAQLTYGNLSSDMGLCLSTQESEQCISRQRLKLLEMLPHWSGWLINSAVWMMPLFWFPIICGMGATYKDIPEQYIQRTWTCWSQICYSNLWLPLRP